MHHTLFRLISHHIHVQLTSHQDLKLLASFNNHEDACNMLCGKGRVRTQDLGYQSGVLWPLRYTPGLIKLYHRCIRWKSVYNLLPVEDAHSGLIIDPPLSSKRFSRPLFLSKIWCYPRQCKSYSFLNTSFSS